MSHLYATQPLALYVPNMLSAYLVPSSVADWLSLVFLVGILGAVHSQGTLWGRPDPLRKVFFEVPQRGEKSPSKSPSDRTRNFAIELERAKKSGLILWGSQSGTAEVLAQRLVRHLADHLGLHLLQCDLSEYDAHTLALLPASAVVVFIVSTYGEGEPSDNAVGFRDWLVGQAVSLSHLQYAVLGLGNSDYKLYNRAGDQIDEGMQARGARPLMAVRRADAAKNTAEEDFMTWKDDLGGVLGEQLGYCATTPVASATMEVVEVCMDAPIEYPMATSVVSSGRDSAGQLSAARLLRVSEARELCTGSRTSCVHLELTSDGHSPLRYKTGDHLGIWAENTDHEIDCILQALGLLDRRHIPIAIRSLNDTKSLLPAFTTYDALFRQHLAIAAPVNRDLVRTIAAFAPRLEAKDYLLQLARDPPRFKALTDQMQLTIGRLLLHAAPACVWTSLPLPVLLDNLTPMRPRYYSISDSSVVSPRRISITVSASEMALRTGAGTIYGTASNYLRAIAVHGGSVAHDSKRPSYRGRDQADSLVRTVVHAHVRLSSFKLPKAPTRPLIMIATGTGIAPFRAFIRERRHLQSLHQEVGPMRLIFGCRNARENYLYRDELQELEAGFAGQLSIATAFSREPTLPKTYVQDVIADQADELIRLIEEENACVYLCGKAAMARHVESEFRRVFMSKKGWSETQLVDFMTSLKRSQRWQEDVWG